MLPSNKTPAPSGLISMLPLFLVLFIDGMGLGLLFPILSEIFVDPHSIFISATVSIAHRQILYGFTIAVFMICWFFGATILGDLSDMIGRKKSLMICLIGAFLSYLLSAVAMLVASIPLLILGRMVAGLTAGSQPIAQAAIVDVSSNEQKGRNIGLILLSVSLGFVFGPLIGGLLSDSHLVSWFNYATPMYFASFISLVNAILLQLTFKESFLNFRVPQIKIHRAIEVFVSAFSHKKIRWLSLCLLILIFGWSNYFSFIAMFTIVRFHYTPVEASLFMTLLGIGFSIGCSWLVNIFPKYLSKNKTIAITNLFSAGCALITAWSHNPYTVAIAALFIGMSMSVSYSTILVIFSDQVSETEQGWVMGVTGSIMALCFGLTTFLTGFVAAFGVEVPMQMAAAGLILSGIMIGIDRFHQNS